MRGAGSVNADGFGIGWLVDSVGSPHAGTVARRYRRDRPIWSDATLPDLAESVTSGAILAAVRNATVGMPVVETACAPFVEGSWMFSHNGFVQGWPDSVAPLAKVLPPAVLMTLEAPTDSAFLWALVRARLREGHSGAKALAGVAEDVMAMAPRSRLNLLLHDGPNIAATTVTHSLWVLQGEGHVMVSSEPLDPDDERWQPVPDLCLLEATATQHSISPLFDQTSSYPTSAQGSP
ncbi:MAG: gamma-glutamyl hercynylcysteine S-oxide hydrolase [Actinomycetota bacterium]|jgi:glutamine amidotransferase|nr:gamma-glutamyl hercynylcysteine S-oxide hydrolase [Actinomycetota bacterium]